MSRFIGLHVIHVVLPIPNKHPNKQKHFSHNGILKKNVEQEVLQMIDAYFIEPPSSPVTIQFSL